MGTLTRRLWERRSILAVGTLIGIGVLATAAAVTDYGDIDVRFTEAGADSFNIVVAGSLTSGWTPSDSDWAEGRPTDYSIKLENGTRPGIAPGGTLKLRIAIRNVSPELASVTSLAISDTNSQVGKIDPASGTFVELFDQLHFTVDDGGTRIMDAVPGSRIADGDYTWPVNLKAGEVKVLDLTISLPAEVDNRWNGAGTNVRFHFDAENA